MIKNAVYVKTADQFWIDLAAYWQQNENWNATLCVGSSKGKTAELLAQFPDLHFYEQSEAMLAIPPSGLKYSQLEPLDKCLLAELSEYETLFYKMVERYALDFDSISTNDLRQYFLRLCRIWLTIYRHYKINVLVIPTIPHRVFDYVAYFVGQTLGTVTCVMLEVTPYLVTRAGARRNLGLPITDLSDRTALFNNPSFWEHKTRAEANRLDTSSSLNMIKTQTWIESRADSLVDRETHRFPWYTLRNMEHLVRSIPYPRGRSAVSVIIVLARILNLLFQGRLFQRSSLLRFKNFNNRQDSPQFGKLYQELWKAHLVINKTLRAIDWYNEACSHLTTIEKYVFVAPHFEPERTTVPDGGAFHNIVDIVIVLNAALPEGWILCYKEHPSNFLSPIGHDNTRNIEFYEYLRYLCPSIKFIDVKHDTHDLIDNAQVVATVSGTVGWEARVRGKPVLMFGDAFYRRCPGVTKVNDIDDCRQVLDKINRNEILLFDQDVVLFVEQFVRGCVDVCDWWRSVEMVTLRENNETLYSQRIKLFADSFSRAVQQSDELRLPTQS